MCKHRALVRDMLISIWEKRNIKAIEQYFSDNIVYNHFLGKVISKKNLYLTLLKFYKLFSTNTFTIDTITEKNNVVFVKWHGYVNNDKPFDELQPTFKLLKFNVIGFYKIENFLIVKATAVSNLKFNIMKHGATPDFYKINNFIKTLSINKLSTEMQNTFNIPLSKQEILTMTLWLTGHSTKMSGKMLNISPRTIEEYRRRIKNKLHIKNKQQLYDFMQNLEYIEIFLELSKNISKLAHQIDIK